MSVRDLIKANAATGSYVTPNPDAVIDTDVSVTAARLRELYAEIGRLRMADPAFRAKVNAGIRRKWADPAFKADMLRKMAAGMVRKYGG